MDFEAEAERILTELAFAELKARARGELFIPRVLKGELAEHLELVFKRGALDALRRD